MGVCQLGYVGLNVTDVGSWAELLGPTLGVGVNVAKDGDQEVTLAELDEFRYRLALYPSAEDSPRHIGWVVDSSAEMERLTGRLEQAGFGVKLASSEEAALRGATDVRWFIDPAGYRVELALGQAKVRVRAARPADATPGVTGLGHFVLASPKRDELRELYEGVLEFKLTDYRAPGLFFFRCNANHHSVALAHADVTSIHHLELEHGSLDDVGRANDRASANGVPISISLGRHMNDKAISFYVQNPSGFHLEIGCGSIQVGDDWTPYDFGFADVWGHHHANPNPFAHPTDTRPAANGE
jgi:2,3-dihydroxybiphenyl 1,2-dioxygenase